MLTIVNDSRNIRAGALLGMKKMPVGDIADGHHGA
jgi:hypothetical protein